MLMPEHMLTKMHSTLRASLAGRHWFTLARDTSLIPDWEARAKCAGYPVEWFFGDEREVVKHAQVRTNEQTRKAKEVCAGCHVRAECLTWAIREEFEWGVFGGLTEREIAKVRENLDAIKR